MERIAELVAVLEAPGHHSTDQLLLFPRLGHVVVPHVRFAEACLVDGTIQDDDDGDGESDAIALEPLLLNTGDINGADEDFLRRFVNPPSTRADRYLRGSTQEVASRRLGSTRGQSASISSFGYEQNSLQVLDALLAPNAEETESHTVVSGRGTVENLMCVELLDGLGDEEAQKILMESLFRFGEQDAAVLDSLARSEDSLKEMELDRARRAADQGVHFVMNDAGGGSTVTLASKQDGFRLDSIFKTSAEDMELFGVTESDLESDAADESEDERDSASSALWVPGPGLSNGADSILNAQRKREAYIDEVDELLAGDTVSEYLRARAIDRTSETEPLAPRQAFSWAVAEETDVSDFSTLVPNPAIKYPFDLDVFQRRSIFRLERGESLFVSAHTSAGKTVVAEYAIALARLHRSKAIYTSPIKTLSNQKFREFSKVFDSVGIVTGDVSIRPEADCLVMTTEILRSMLYKGADLIRDVEWVIFDEVHYINDAERGVVWEETIILLPEHVRFVFLSATVPNALQFASWVGRTKQRLVYVTGTPKRPVPLEHSLLVHDKAFELVSSSARHFNTINYKQALAYEKEKTAAKKAGSASVGRHSWPKLVNFLSKNDMLPTIVFCFSKKRCDEAANLLRSVDLTAGSSEKAEVHLIFDSAITRLSQDDRDVPQIMRMREMLKRGIGVHHAGLLPIVKEITEILFQRGLVRILFATETFAMGVNMPARAVVFSGIRKHDGETFRALNPGEFQQMSGRAGRRGLDSVGFVMLYFASNDIPSELELRQLLTGTPHRLSSVFRLTYNMILNLLRVEDLRVEDVMRKSFAEAAAERNSHRIRVLLEKGESVLKELEAQNPEVDKYRFYHSLCCDAERMRALAGKELLSRAPSEFVAGRVLLVSRSDRGLALAVVVRSPKVQSRGPRLTLAGDSAGTGQVEEDEGPAILVLVLCDGISGDSSSPYYMPALECSGDVRTVGGYKYELVRIVGSRVALVLDSKVALDANSIDPIRGAPALSELVSVLSKLSDMVESDTIPAARHPQKDMGIADLEFTDFYLRYEALVDQMRSLRDVAGSSFLGQAMRVLDKQRILTEKLSRLRWALSDESLQLLPDYYQRISVLKRMNYVDADSVVLLKGRAACEVNTCDSLIIGELIFESVFNPLSPPDCAALLAALVFQEKTEVELDDAEMSEAFGLTKIRLGKILVALGTVQAECGLVVSPVEYQRNSARFGVSHAVFAWANGATFKAVCELSDVPEGSLVRVIVRLSELIREVRNVAHVIGDAELFQKMERANALIKRDIIFAASLYLQ
ncbi:DExH-box ATP-dependent RNA helicase DExH11 [Porphyridium purpureum]|uniref:DExH-box ATP-dependent RNA helicase DExH11 n=1 Tax=Porphyridium purpureum TaxID=35688 RepID=A0A5J4YM16_PORPP|nr:DExH-box ATP-dependent RNA helicase DExH11 [Porphyridium purpureum]|eukprot:POR6639..scf295_9